MSARTTGPLSLGERVREQILLLLLLLTTGCFIPRDTEPTSADKPCTSCHGDASREGDRLLRAAPPFDIFGNTGTQFPGVGAHELHLRGTSNSAAVPCAQCHRVPERSLDDGHNDGVTTLTEGTSYDSATRRCTTACHRGTSGVWTRPLPEAQRCGTCHALGPAAPHPRAGSCSVCHAGVISEDGGIVNPQLHVDGTVQVADVACNACHGDRPSGLPTTGAHVLHAQGGLFTRPVGCEECHVVPAKPATPAHPNGGSAEVLASIGWSRANATCLNACHGPSPSWISGQSLSCAGCHGAPPPPPHPAVQNCQLCHSTASGPLGREFADRTRHVDGVLDVNVPAACDACHGSAANPAPPRDTNGATATTLRSVGAHQAHVVGRGLARVVQCNECHRVPPTTVSAGHIDGQVQVVFGGVALANLAQPTWDSTALTCANAACHDISNWTSAPGGGSAVAPLWTRVDGTQASCTSCHGLPPPPPHPVRTDCEGCHLNATPQRTFVRPELHINGRVEFALP